MSGTLTVTVLAVLFYVMVICNPLQWWIADLLTLSMSGPTH